MRLNPGLPAHSGKPATPHLSQHTSPMARAARMASCDTPASSPASCPCPPASHPGTHTLLHMQGGLQSGSLLCMSGIATLPSWIEDEKQKQALPGQARATNLQPLGHHTPPARSTRSCVVGCRRLSNLRAAMLWPLPASALLSDVCHVCKLTRHAMHARW